MHEEKRQYIRHPASIPIVYNDVNAPDPKKHRLRDISIGGMSFRTDWPLEKGTTLVIQIDLVQPTFRGAGTVVWCRPHDDHYDVGVQFGDEDTEFRARMVEQICHIEQDKRDILKKEGRNLSGEEAALEWITKYAGDFPGTR